MLPPLGRPRSSLAAPLREAWALVDEILANPPPPLPPSDPHLAAIEHYLEHQLEPWDAKHKDQLQLAVDLLQAAAHIGAPEGVVASALEGLVVEERAEPLFHVPTVEPGNDLISMRQAWTFNGAIEASQRKARKQLLDLYRACQRMAGPAEMPAWRAYCAKRASEVAKRGPRGEPKPSAPTVCHDDAIPSTPLGEAAKSVLVLPVSGDAPLLGSERRHLGEAIRERMSQLLHAPVLDDKALDGIADRVQAGQLLANGPTCAQPPDYMEVAARDPRVKYIVWPSAQCVPDHGCTLHITVDAPEGRSAADVKEQPGEQAIDGDPTRTRSWSEAASRITLQSTDSEWGILGEFSPGAKPVRSVWSSGALSHEAAKAIMETANDALEGCKEMGENFDVYGALEIGAHGRVRRQWASDADGWPSELARCVSQHLAKLVFEGAARGDRIGYHAAMPQWAAPTGLCHQRSTDPDLLRYAAPSELTDFTKRARKCVAPGDEALVFAQLTVNAAGAVTSAKILPLVEGTTDPTTMPPCVEAELRKTRWTCTRSGAPAHMSFTVRISGPEAPAAK